MKKIIIWIILVIVAVFIGSVLWQMFYPYVWGECMPNYDRENMEFISAYKISNHNLSEVQLFQKYANGTCIDGSNSQRFEVVFHKGDLFLTSGSYSEYVYYCENDNQFIVYRLTEGGGFISVMHGKPCK
jgi:hypothetical protein